MPTSILKNRYDETRLLVGFIVASFSLALLAAVFAPSPAQAAVRCPVGCYPDFDACVAGQCGAGTSCAACEDAACTSVPSCDAPASTNAPAPAAPAPRRTRLTNPLGAGVTIETLAGRAVRGFIGLSGSFALLMFVYGGFMWVTSAGNPDKVKKGKQIFTYAVVGLIVIFGAYAFLTTFINALGTAGSSS